MAVDDSRRRNAGKKMEEEEEMKEENNMVADFPSDDVFLEPSHSKSQTTAEEEPEVDRGKTFWSAENETIVAGAP